MNNLTGKTALITGGSSGIGLAMAKQLAGMGMQIWIMARNPGRLESACEEISACCKSPDQQVHTLTADVSNLDQVQQALEPMLSQVGVPDLLVNSAGVTYPGYFEDLDLQIYRDMMEINYFGTLYVTKLLTPGMIKRRSGQIINISSLVGIHGLFGYSAYAASKFAVVGLSDALRYELKQYGIRVSVAFPTDVDTPQLAFENEFKPPVLKALVEANNKPVSPDAVARTILREALKGRYYILATSDMKLLYFVSRLFPGNSIYNVVDVLISQARSKVAKNNGGH